MDQDCDGADDYDQDNDGWTVDEDCDDRDSTSYPGAEGLDEDCNPADTGHGPEDSLSPQDSTTPPGLTYKGGGGCQGCAGAGTPLAMLWLGILALGAVRKRRS